MAIQIAGETGTVPDANPGYKALRVSAYPAEALGFYRFSAMTGLQTATVAGTATLGGVFAMRNPHATTLVIIQYVRIRWQMVTAFTTAQEVNYRIFIARSFSALHTTGGTVIAGTVGGFKKRASYPTSVLGTTNAIIATTAGLTGGTFTLDSQEMNGLNTWSQTGAAPAVMPAQETFLDATNSGDSPIILAQNEGIVVRNEILMGAAGTGRLLVEVAWYEADAYP